MIACASTFTAIAGCGTRACVAREGEPKRANTAVAVTTAAVSCCVVSGGSSASARAEGAVVEPVRPSEPFTLDDSQGRPIEVYPPIMAERRAPLIVVLHATCMKPASVCDWFGSAARDSGWLVCPSGNSTCYGEPDWNGTGPTKAAFLEAAIARVEERVPAFVDPAPGVLIGWSRGAFAARDIIQARVKNPQPGSVAKRFRGLVLLAANVAPDLPTLKAAGIVRVVMGAGDYDGSRPTMTAAVSSLRAAGFEARYVSLGKIAHVWPDDFESRMREPIAWAAGRQNVP